MNKGPSKPKAQKLVCLLIALSLALSGCASASSAHSGISPDEAVQLVRQFEASQQVSYRYSDAAPFFVGSPDEYAKIVREENLISGYPSPERFSAAVIFVVFRQPFLPQGGGYEVVYLVDRETGTVAQGAKLLGR